MKPTLTLLIAIVMALPVCAQAQRIYFDVNMNPVTDSTKAASKVLLGKYSEDTTLWSAKQYTMDNKLMVDGVYKDRALNVPNGPFKYYFNNGDSHYLAHSGTFFNGAKFGEWIDYYADGKRMKLTTMRAGQMNGPFAYYNDRDTTPTVTGQYLQGKKTGEWVYASRTDVYKDDVVVQSTPNKEYEKQNAMIIAAAQKKRRSQMTSATAPPDFGQYMQRRLASYFKPYMETQAGTAIILTFTVTEQGKLINGKSLTKVNDNVQEQVARAIETAPYWTPAENDGKPVAQKINYTFVLDNIR